MDIILELQKAFNGDAWHGSNVSQILNNVDATKVFSHFIPNAHSIAEITLHLTAWTEEVTSRLQGNDQKEPSRGDWPVPKEMSTNYWAQIQFDFQTSNQALIKVCEQLKSFDWDKPVKSILDPQSNKSITNKELVNGLIQHHAYHAGQIALLTKF